MAQLTVQIVTPDGLVYDHHASFVSVRTLDGEMGILPRHQNMIAVLAVDEVKVKRVDDDSHVNWIAVNGGIIEIANDVIGNLDNPSIHCNPVHMSIVIDSFYLYFINR